jgi:hypothetical protein
LPVIARRLRSQTFLFVFRADIARYAADIDRFGLKTPGFASPWSGFEANGLAWQGVRVAKH